MEYLIKWVIKFLTGKVLGEIFDKLRIQGRMQILEETVLILQNTLNYVSHCRIIDRKPEASTNPEWIWQSNVRRSKFQLSTCVKTSWQPSQGEGGTNTKASPRVQL